MKKILFLLLLTVASYGQVSTGQETEFDYGIKNNSTQTITTPTYLTTTGIDGTQGKIPSAYIAKTEAVQDSLNKKLNLPTGLTTNYLPKWNGSGFGNSIVQEVGSELQVNGSVLVATSIDNGVDKLQVNGSTKTTALTLSTAPTTSAGTYDILTINSSTGVVEKVGNSLFIKTTTLQTAETAPLNLFKITPFTSGYEAFGIDFNSFPNSGGGAGTYNHGTWIGYNTGWHSGTPITTGKPSIMMGFEDNYFDNTGDLDFGTEWYVQGWSPNGTTVKMSRPFYARGFQKDNGNDAWTIISNIGAIGTNRNFTVREGVNTLFQIIPTKAEFYTSEFNVNSNFRLQSGNLILDNNKYIQVKNSIGSVGSVFKIDTDNTLYLGDIFNTFSNNVIFRSGGVSSVTLTNTGNIIANVTPTTSAGTYDILTRNTSTVVFEKITSASVAPIASPAFTGTPTAPTAAVGTNTTQIATTAFVQENVGANTYWTKTGDNIANNNSGIVTVAGMQFGNLGGNAFATFNRYGNDIVFILGNGAIGTGQATDIKITNDTEARIVSTSNLKLSAYNSDKVIVSNNRVESLVPIKLKNYTVSTLPTGIQGDTAYVTDATAPTYLGTLTGGGSVVCPVFYNGTSWVSH